jgi:NAD(P)-dependent dehydrogenase (short-subunit alcohol dehydrogenase family)
MQSTTISQVPRRVVLVTGAAKRLGRAISVHLSAHGFDLVLHYRHSEADARETAAMCIQAGARAHLLAADLTDEAATQALVEQAVGKLGRLDAVVNNASSFEHDDIATFRYAHLAQQMAANVAPALVLARELHAHVQQRGGTGCVVNLLDQKLWNPNPDFLSYTLSKAALESATGLLARALAPLVRVCGVAPGITLVSGDMNGIEFSKAHEMTPLGRSSQPLDIAHSVRFLIEAPAITGTTLIVDGGQHLQAQSRDVVVLAREALQTEGAPCERNH